MKKLFFAAITTLFASSFFTFVQKTLLQMMNKLFWKSKESNIRKAPCQDAKPTKATLTTKISKASLYLLAILSALLLPI